MITLYSGPVSWFARKAEAALHEKGLAFRQVVVPFTQTEGYSPKDPEVVRINPKGQVPVLVDGDVELYDSTVIVEYLDEAYPSPPLFPQSPVARAHCRLWDVFADEVMIVPIRKLMHRTEPHDLSGARWQELEQSAAAAMAQISACFARLDGGLRQADHLCGEFSAADIACFMAVFWSDRLAGPPIGRFVHMEAWYRRLRERPSLRRVTSEVIAQDRNLSARVAGAFAA